MVLWGVLRALGLCLLGAGVGWAQSLPTAATIESIPLELTMPERYRVTTVLEPVRKVALVAPADGIVRGLEAPLGTVVRASAEVAQLDRAEALARLKMAQAEVKEKQLLGKSNQNYKEVYAAQLEAAQAKAELAQLELDRLSLRAPFAGRITALPVSSGTVCAERHRDRRAGRRHQPEVAGSRGSQNRLGPGRSESLCRGARADRESPVDPASAGELCIAAQLAAPFASAWVVVPNAKGELAPGLRVRSANLPITPIATVPKESLKTTEGSAGSVASTVQVLRNEYVTNVPVDLLGKMGPERLQVSGALRFTDALIVSSSVPLLPGTLVRFAQTPGQAIEGTTPNPARQGVEAGITPPGAAATEPAAVPSGSSRSRSASGRPARPTPAVAPAQGQGSPPF